MEAATDTTNAPEAATTSKDARAREAYRQEAGTILLAATPIGDVRDASPRVVAALQGADIVAAEDTRRALALASRLGIKLGGRLVALHDHNEAEKAAGIVEAARGGARVVFVSDAGMPTVSDPGFRLARAAIDAGVPLSVLPGPSAPLVALALSGLPSDRFAFEGFLPRKDGDATRYLQDLATDPHTLIFFESPRRAAATLTRMAEVFGADRAAALCRELTKDYEEVRRGTLGQLAEGADDVLGEVTIVVAGYARSARAEDHVGAVLALASEGMRLKDAAAEVAAATGARKNDLYKAALAARYKRGRGASDDLDVLRCHPLTGRRAQFLGHGRGQLAQHTRLEVRASGVDRRARDAVRFREAHDVHIRDAGVAQRLLQRLAILGRSLETRVGSLVLAFLDRHVRVHVGERRVQLGLGRARDAVRGPGVHEIRRLGEVSARIDVPILRGDDQLVLVAMRVHVGGHGLGDGVTTRHREGTPFAERGLNVDDNECAGHGTSQKIQ